MLEETDRLKLVEIMRIVDGKSYIEQVRDLIIEYTQTLFAMLKTPVTRRWYWILLYLYNLPFIYIESLGLLNVNHITIIRWKMYYISKRAGLKLGRSGVYPLLLSREGGRRLNSDCTVC